MEISTTFMIIVSLSLSSAFSDLCEITTDADIKWRRHPDDCSSAFMCLLGHVVSYSCPDGFVIGSDEITCIPSGSSADDCSGLALTDVEDVAMQPFKRRPACKEGERIPDETNCSKYSECVVLPDGTSTMLPQQCAFPFLFEMASGKCDHFKDVVCQPDQTVPKSACDYSAHQCTSVHCIPCNIRFPTCTGLPDGKNPWVGREWSPDYVVCEEERVVLQGQCKSPKEQQVFHPDRKSCVVYDVKTIVG